MERYYFKTRGSEPDEECIERCQVLNNGVMIGSYSCTLCEFNKGSDLDINDPFSLTSWIICSKLSQARGVVLNTNTITDHNQESKPSPRENDF